MVADDDRFARSGGSEKPGKASFGLGDVDPNHDHIIAQV
jgi:hypothetical protein